MPISLPISSPPQCDYFAAGVCRSCTLIETPYAQQLAAKAERCRELLLSVPADAWLPPVAGGERDFRNKAKLVVGGTPGEITLGILGPDGLGVDLRECLIQSGGIRDAIAPLAAFLEATGLPPYVVPERRGELKFVHVTEAPAGARAGSGADASASASASASAVAGAGETAGALMLRFVVRTRQALDRIRKMLPDLLQLVPRATVVSVNLLPDHKAVLEGEHEEMLLGSSLEMGLGQVSLHLQPQSFFQTNTLVAQALYAQAAEWVDRVNPASLWDLYCGVGGFALHCAGAGAGAEAGTSAGAGRDVLGVELSASAVRSAERSAAEAGINARFHAADATQFALAATPEQLPELVIVNPPRRGIGADLSAWLENGPVRHVVYSSCNPESLARNLAAMPSFAVQEARVFDMFPHTNHLEVAVLLERVAG